MENPYQTMLYWIPGAIAFVAGILPAQSRSWKVVQSALLCIAAAVFWGILQHSVSWAYDRSFNPNDGAPKTFALLFGWLFGLIFPIAPVWIVVRGLRWITSRVRDTVPLQPGLRRFGRVKVTRE
jgi:hypothetical protein